MINDRSQDRVFGPVPSRRLGRSLGVDLVPFKTCVYNCIYCQIGWTTNNTIERAEYVPTEEVISEVREKLESGVAPDYITLSGSGEPTLHSRIGEIIDAIKGMTDIPVAVLTNGALFFDPDVRGACAKADVVIPSLDAGDEETFRRINCPSPGITLQKVVEGLAAFRNQFEGEIWLEVFLVSGINDDARSLERIRKLAESIRPDRIQLNTAVRPTADENVSAIPLERLEEIRQTFGEKAEVIAEFRPDEVSEGGPAQLEDILMVLRRRPCTAEDIANGLNIHIGVVMKLVGRLAEQGLIEQTRKEDKLYYHAR